MNNIMNIFDVGLDGWNIIYVRFNWVAVIVLIIAFLILSFILKRVVNIANKHCIIFDEIFLGIGRNSSVKLKYNRKDQEVAYKLWVELSTRKIGLPFDQENDVITEVYNSWYDFFKIARELLKDIPASRLPYSNDLIKLTERVLNVGLRPHLTKWQAKYRKWYNNEFIKKKQ